MALSLDQPTAVQQDPALATPPADGECSVPGAWTTPQVAGTTKRQAPLDSS